MALRGLVSSRIHFPASLGSTVVTRFLATMDALTPFGRFFGPQGHELRFPRRVSLIPALGLPAIPSPTIGATTGDRPVVRRLGSSPIARFTGFATHSKARPSTPTESSSHRPHLGACVTDWSFSLRCSPPRLAATQLRFHTPRLFAAEERTFTALTQRHLRRT